MDTIAEKTMPAKMLAFKHTLTVMQDRYPLAFPKAKTTKVHPLKLKIHEDIRSAIDAGELSITRAQLRQFMRYWCNTKFYLRAMVPGAQRVDLSGEPAGVVTQDEIKAGAGLPRPADDANQGSTETSL